MDWDELVAKLTRGEVEDPRDQPEKKSLTERVQKPQGESVGFQRLTRVIINVGRAITTAVFIAFGAIGLMWFNMGLAATFPEMPPGISFYNAFFVFGGAVLAWSIFKRLTRG